MTAPLPPLLLRGDCLVELARIPDESVDAVVCDPPYGLEFMGKAWDKYTPLDFEEWTAKWAAECLRILKPGGHLLAFGGSRTWHRLAAGIEDAGFEIRDSIAWLYGSGFPKSLDVSKAIDKAAGATREKTSTVKGAGIGACSTFTDDNWKGIGAESFDRFDRPATDAAREWEGWGTALKPAFEPVVVARKPMPYRTTVAANVLEYGTGALNIDATRIETDDALSGSGQPMLTFNGDNARPYQEGYEAKPTERHPGGRWPANVVLDESQAAALDVQSGTKMSRGHTPRRRKGAADDAIYTLGHTGQAAIVEAHAEESCGTALKPAFEPVVVARKPLGEKTVAANVLEYGTGALNIDATRIGHASEADLATSLAKNPGRDGETVSSGVYGAGRPQQSVNTSGRWPANVVLDESQAAALDVQSGTLKGAVSNGRRAGNGAMFDPGEQQQQQPGSGDAGGASRFFYVAKAPKSERPVYWRPSCNCADPAILSEWSETSVCANCGAPSRRESHATVKPLALMRWLCRLVTPPGGVVVDPFAGSGTTLEAAYLEGFESIGVEITPEYWPLIAARIERVTR